MVSQVPGSMTSFTNLQCSTMSHCLRKGRALFPLCVPDWTPSFLNPLQRTHTLSHHVLSRRKTSVIPVPACSSCQALQKSSNLKLLHQTITMPLSLAANRETTSLPEPGLCPKPREDFSLSLKQDLPQEKPHPDLLCAASAPAPEAAAPRPWSVRDRGLRGAAQALHLQCVLRVQHRPVDGSPVPGRPAGPSHLQARIPRKAVLSLQ